MRLHYFNQQTADADDAKLRAVIDQGHVPATCLLGGAVVTIAVNEETDPCSGCNGPRARCGGREKQEDDSAAGYIKNMLEEGLGIPKTLTKPKLPI